MAEVASIAALQWFKVVLAVLGVCPAALGTMPRIEARLDAWLDRARARVPVVFVRQDRTPKERTNGQKALQAALAQKASSHRPMRSGQH